MAPVSEMLAAVAAAMACASVALRLVSRPVQRVGGSIDFEAALMPHRGRRAAAAHGSLADRIRRDLHSAGSLSILGGIRRSARTQALAAQPEHGVSVQMLAAIKGLLMLISTPLLLLGGFGVLAVPLVSFAAYRLPDAFLHRRAGRRRRRIDAEIPQLLDVLAAASSAGLSATLALQRSAAAIRGPLAEEIAGTLDAVSLGARWRTELRALATRVDLPDLHRLVNALTRTETLGVSLSDALRALGSETRAARRAIENERARKAPVKMLFPLVFMILPAFLLLTVVPVLLSTLRSIS